MVTEADEMIQCVLVNKLWTKVSQRISNIVSFATINQIDNFSFTVNKSAIHKTLFI